jgi:hypothetical protein
MNETSTYNEDAGNTRELIVRIDERTRSMARGQDDLKKEVTTEFASMEARMTLIEKNIGGLEKSISELQPVKKIVFGGVGFILLAVIGAILGYVITHGANQ